MTVASDARATTVDVVREVVVNGPILRRDLAARLAISLATLSRLSAPLVAQGVIVEVEAPHADALGRPARLLDVPEHGSVYLGIKLRGDSAIGVLTDIRANELATSEVSFTDRSVSSVVNTIAALADGLGEGRTLAGVGVSVGGHVSRASIVDRDVFLDWMGVNLGGALAVALGVPVTVENDVVALTEAEHWFGLGRGVANFAVLTIGAGIGFGLVRESQVVRISDAGLGLASHVPLDARGPTCELGHVGCSSAMLTTSSVRAAAESALGQHLNHAALVSLARDGDPVAVDIVSRASRALGTLVALVANLAMIETVVLAGEGISILDIARNGFDASLATSRDPEARPIAVLIDESGFTSWARGAAVVAIQQGMISLATA